MDIAKISAVEAELDNFISRRHEKRILEEGERLAEEMWAESERRYEARRREENHAAWCKYHQDQAARHRATLETLATYHEGEAAKLQLEVAVVEGEGDRLLSSVCRANKRDDSPCTAPATGANGFCWAHDPANSEQRRRIASKGGRGKGGGELSDLKRQVKDLVADVLDGKVERGQAAVANQLYNTLIRAIEQERKLRELEELAQRLEAMEEVLKGRKVG